MDIKSIESRYHLKVYPAAPKIQALTNRINTYEHRYKMSSRSMIRALNKSTINETREICSWLHDYHDLLKLKNGKNGAIKTNMGGIR